MRVCSVCNEILTADQGCDRTDCPAEGLSSTAGKTAKVEPGYTGKADRAVQAGLDRASDAARDATRRTTFVMVLIFAAVCFGGLIAFNIRGGSERSPTRGTQTETSPAAATNSGSMANNITLAEESYDYIEPPLPPNPAFNNNVWMHNGSIVRLYASGQRRAFYYESPRSGLPVEAGQLLFYGSREGNTYLGTAHRFSANCGTTSYEVRGSVEPSQTTIILSGVAPRRDQGCNVIGTFVDRLKFELLHQ
jgi:hypothetical protein